MTASDKKQTPGMVALVGSGEYLDVMNDVDTFLLATRGETSKARVALLPTASGLEPNGPSSWNELGLRHFKGLGINDVRATQIIDRASAADPQQLALLKAVDLYYFSGGNPQYSIETMQGSPAWEIIKAAYEQGAVLAGCSAGAMMLSAQTISIRQMMTGGNINFVKALGIVPNVIVFPHFDRMTGFIDQQRFLQLLQTIPPEFTVVGIDEKTALVRLETNEHTGSLWRTLGQKSVSIYAHGQQTRTLHNGDEIQL